MELQIRPLVLFKSWDIQHVLDLSNFTKSQILQTTPDTMTKFYIGSNGHKEKSSFALADPFAVGNIIYRSGLDQPGARPELRSPLPQHRLLLRFFVHVSSGIGSSIDLVPCAFNPLHSSTLPSSRHTDQFVNRVRSTTSRCDGQANSLICRIGRGNPFDRHAVLGTIAHQNKLIARLPAPLGIRNPPVALGLIGHLKNRKGESILLEIPTIRWRQWCHIRDKFVVDRPRPTRVLMGARCYQRKCGDQRDLP